MEEQRSNLATPPVSNLLHYIGEQTPEHVFSQRSGRPSYSIHNCYSAQGHMTVSVFVYSPCPIGSTLANVPQRRRSGMECRNPGSHNVFGSILCGLPVEQKTQAPAIWPNQRNALVERN